MPAGNLSLQPAQSVVLAGNALQWTASGGVPPYAFSITGGSGSIDASTGLYGADLAGAAQVSVADAAGHTASSDVLVKLAVSVSSNHLSAGLAFQALSASAPPQLMHYARAFHSQITLRDGRVLVTGNGGDIVSGTAEIFDPAAQAGAGAWTVVSPMATPRYLHAMVQVTNDQVLVMGGSTIGGTTLTTTEILTLSTGTWAAGPPMASARANFTADLLPNGTVLAAGGQNSGGDIAGTEIFDPTSGTWSAATPLSHPRSNHNSVALPSGRILIAGGLNGNSLLYSSIEYDPTTGQWVNGANFTDARYYSAMTMLADGRAILVGGAQNNAIASVEIYNPGTFTWSSTGSLATARYLHSIALLPDHTVIAFGGTDGTYDVTTAEIYNPTAGTWSAGPAPAFAAYGAAATTLLDGSVLMSGGLVPEDGGPVPHTQIFRSGAWTTYYPSAHSQAGNSAVLLPGGKLLVVGGSEWSSDHLKTEIFDPTASAGQGAWLATGSRQAIRSSAGVASLGDGRVLVAGGYAYPNSLSSTEIYDPSAGTWSAGPAIPERFGEGTATSLTNGKVILAGGQDGGTTLGATYVFDPTAGVWSAGPTLATARSLHSAIALPNGKALIVGGITQAYAVLDSVEIYDPGSASIIAGTALPGAAAVYQPHLAQLTSGKILLAGGRGATYAPTAYATLYDPAAGTWTPVPAMAFARAYASLTALPDGRAIIIGGTDNVTMFATSEIFDPQAAGGVGAWTAGPSLSTGRIFHSATLLADGRVFVAGGSGEDGAQTGAFMNPYRIASISVAGARGSLTFNLLSGLGTIFSQGATAQFLPSAIETVQIGIGDAAGDQADPITINVD